MRKRLFGHVRTAKVQTSLRIRVVRSGHSLSANRIIEYNRMFGWRANARVRLCACAGYESAILRILEGTFSRSIKHEKNATFHQENYVG